MRIRIRIPYRIYIDDFEQFDNIRNWVSNMTGCTDMHYGVNYSLACLTSSYIDLSDADLVYMKLTFPDVTYG